MNFSKAPRIICFSFFLWLGLAASSKEPGPGPRAIGAGAHPLSFTEASAWFAHQANQSSKALTVLFYFQGTPGWLTEKTDFQWQINQNPATIDMTVGTVPIHLKYWQNTDEVEVLGKRYSRSAGNVFLIAQIDSATPAVSSLGNHDLTFKPDDIPPVVLLRRDPDVWASLTGHPRSDHPALKVTGSEQVRAWDAEGVRLLGSSKPQDQRKACELFRRAAEQGYAPSQYRTGYCYESGIGGEQNFVTANQWYVKAGEQGYVDAQYKLGHSYRTGRGTQIDLATALNWYKKAAASGDIEALHNVGWMYATGQGTKMDQVEAYRWFLEAAKHGEAGTQFEVARRLNEGEGVNKDPTLSYSWLLVLKAQQASFPPDDWQQIEKMMTSVEGQLDAAAKRSAAQQAHAWMAVVAKFEMERYANQ
ncbi:MAG TPA: tetratricopeptide repeat protein [Candidatus Angelobacter sp.]|nr:tetratricopeptide repeat protein [Candidatus Angelobacter sp.]